MTEREPDFFKHVVARRSLQMRNVRHTHDVLRRLAVNHATGEDSDKAEYVTSLRPMSKALAGWSVRLLYGLTDRHHERPVYFLPTRVPLRDVVQLVIVPSLNEDGKPANEAEPDDCISFLVGNNGIRDQVDDLMLSAAECADFNKGVEHTILPLFEGCEPRVETAASTT